VAHHDHPELVAEVLQLGDLREGADLVHLVQAVHHVVLSVRVLAHEDADEGHVHVDLAPDELDQALVGDLDHLDEAREERVARNGHAGHLGQEVGDLDGREDVHGGNDQLPVEGLFVRGGFFSCRWIVVALVLRVVVEAGTRNVEAALGNEGWQAAGEGGQEMAGGDRVREARQLAER